MKAFVLFAALATLALITAPKAIASSNDDPSVAALAASKSWISLIDAGNYTESYAFACGAMHEKVAEDRWELILKALRAPWGRVADRQQISHVYKPNGFEGTEGEFMVITYDTTFAKALEATEVVVLKKEDGEWRGAGYNAQLKQDNNNPDSQTQPVTEVHTNEHVTNPPQRLPQ